MIPLPSADTDTESGPEPELEVDGARTALLDALSAELGDAVVDTHLIPGVDLWVRVSTEAWDTAADYLHNRQRFRFFDWLSAIDWMPSPFGRSLDAAVDVALGDTSEAEDATIEADVAGEAAEPATGADGYAGGATRFQVIARVSSLTTGIGVTLKADLADDLTVASWTPHYPGANWHEREAFEMFGIHFTGHPGLRHLYLPGDFEGNPLRKDYPLVARLIKPWPGIVDVEPMPEVPEPAAAADGAAGGGDAAPANGGEA